MTDKSTLYYTCPGCSRSQEVYLVPEDIADGSSYSFTTECADCGTELLVNLGYEISVEERREDD